jgi:uncharacterized protein YyaL (SSP411 family)
MTNTITLLLLAASLLPTKDESGFVGPGARSQILERYLNAFDREHGGWGTARKEVDPIATEYALTAAEHGSEDYTVMAQKTLLKNLMLIDQVQGGAYDYSVATDRNRPWRSPVRSKSTVTQAEELRLYVQAASMWGAREYMGAARSIQAFLENVLTSPEGAYYAGQTARVPGSSSEDVGLDRRIVSKENGLVIGALARLYQVTGDKEAIQRAIRAAEWIIAHRKLPGGGFMSDGENSDGPRLADSVAMGQAMLELYASTGEEKWLAEAEEAAFFIARVFAAEGHGFTSRLVDPEERGAYAAASKDVAENIAVTRFANLLRHYTGQETYRKISEYGMLFLASSEVAESGRSSVGLLLADDELSRNPVQVIIVGQRNDPVAKQLHQAALAHPTTYRVLEWAEPGPAPLRYHYLAYPRPASPAAIACEDDGCAPPAFKVAELTASLRQLAHQ